MESLERVGGIERDGVGQMMLDIGEKRATSPCGL